MSVAARERSPETQGGHIQVGSRPEEASAVGPSSGVCLALLSPWGVQLSVFFQGEHICGQPQLRKTQSSPHTLWKEERWSRKGNPLAQGHRAIA